MVSRPLAGGPVAGLPMYDWPEVHDAVDAVWAAIGGRLRDAGIDAPEGVWRPDRSEDLWTHPDLLIVETCGYQVVIYRSTGFFDLGKPGLSLLGSRMTRDPMDNSFLWRVKSCLGLMSSYPAAAIL